MMFLKRAAAGAAVLLVLFVSVFYHWLAVAAAPPNLPPVEVAQLQAPLSQDAWAVPPAPAQRLVAVEVPGTNWEPAADTLFNALLLAVFVWLIRPVVLKAGTWLGQRAAADELVTDEKMSGLSKVLASQALDYALGKLGYTRADLRDVRVRNSAFSMAADFVHSQWPQLWEWIDQNKNGQIDWLESQTAAEIPPVDHALNARPPAPQPTA